MANMKKTFKKLGALIISAVMVLSLSATLFADGEASLTGGEVGGFTTPDTPVVQSKKVKIQKELTAYNVDGLNVYAPTITYTYAIAPGSANVSITDEITDHNPQGAVTKTTIAGITTNVTMTGTAANTIAWTPADTLTTSTGGTANYKDLVIDFTNVVFTAPGVYRYTITETAATYATSGVTETKNLATEAAGSHVRYLDVYVVASESFTDGTLASDWDIYGYVCLLEDEAITPDGDTTTTGAVKTNGFVAATNDGSTINADSYYTFNVTVSKTLTGDNANKSHEFPIHVDFTNAAVTDNVKLNAAVTGNATDYTHTAAGASSLDGLAKIADGGSIKYIGIPCGTQVEVYETNDVTYVTYKTTVTVDGTAGTAKNITSTSTPSDFVAYNVANYNSLNGQITTTTAHVDDDVSHTIAITNVYQTISPTGVIVRTAPYILLLGAGVSLFVLSRRWGKKEEKV